MIATLMTGAAVRGAEVTEDRLRDDAVAAHAVERRDAPPVASIALAIAAAMTA